MLLLPVIQHRLQFDSPPCDVTFFTSMTRISMLAGVFILLIGPPKPDRLKDRGQTK